MKLLYDTRISGDFEGWDGGKVYVLDNQTKWELATTSTSIATNIDPELRYGTAAGSTF